MLRAVVVVAAQEDIELHLGLGLRLGLTML
jgi:hypothetical protein